MMNGLLALMAFTFVPEPIEGVPVQMFGPERVTDFHKVGPSPEHVRLRDDWKADDAGRRMTCTIRGQAPPCSRSPLRLFLRTRS